MAKAIVISIASDQCRQIVHGEQNVVLTKKRVRIDVPFTCYIYNKESSEVVGEFTCDGVYKIDKDSVDYFYKIGDKTVYFYEAAEMGLNCGKSDDELAQMMNGRVIFGLHIANAKIYDVPKHLHDFWYCGSGSYMDAAPHRLNRRPRGWTYVKKLKHKEK